MPHAPYSSSCSSSVVARSGFFFGRGKEEEEEADAAAVTLDLPVAEEEQQEQEESGDGAEAATAVAGAADADATTADDDEVLAIVFEAARAAGREPAETERALARRLRENWYVSARDVAALSPQELAALGAPMRIRTIAAAAAARAEAAAAADALSGAAAAGDASLSDATSHSSDNEQQQPEPLDPDIMKRRAPLRRRPFKRGSVRVTRKAPGARWVGGEGEGGADGSGSPSSSSSSDSPSLPTSHRHAYGLLEREMHPDLAEELERFERFCTERTLGRRRAPVSRATHQGTVRYLRLMLGWLARVKGLPEDEEAQGEQGSKKRGGGGKKKDNDNDPSSSSPPASVVSRITTLRQAFPSRERSGAALLFEFRDFLERERGANARTVFNAMMSATHAVRFLWGEGESGGGGVGGGGEPGAATASSADQAAADPPILIEVRAMAGAAFKQTRRCPLVSDESKKWLTWPEYAALVAALRSECAGLTAGGNPRSPREVAACLQRYLIFAFLSCIPDRQRTLRELRVGHTLVKEPLTGGGGAVGEGGGGAGAGGDSANNNADPPYRWVVRHGPSDYKTGRLYGARPPLVVAPFLYPELEAYVDTWRKHLEPRHDFLFTTVSRKGGGRPLTASSLYKLFSHTALVVTGRPMNPHLMRDLVVTHLRAQGTGEPEMEALAVYMGHSVKQQRETYDRRTRAQKAAPAVDLMRRMVEGAGGAGGGDASGASLVRQMFSSDGGPPV
jgi:hypothetical protein